MKLVRRVSGTMRRGAGQDGTHNMKVKLRLSRYFLSPLRMMLSGGEMREEHSRHAQQHISAGEFQQGSSIWRPLSRRQQLWSKSEAANSKSSGLMVVVQLVQAARIQS